MPPIDNSDPEFGKLNVPDPFKDRGLQLSGQSAVASDNAMSMLQKALVKSNEVSPDQGLAAMLLSVIPTFGGYLMGSAVGHPNIPKGVYGMSLKDLQQMQTGGASGALEGTKIGEDAGVGYLQSLTANEDKNRPIYEKMAAVEANKAERLQSGADQVINAGLSAQERRDMMPLEEASRIRVAGAEGNASLSREKALVDYKAEVDPKQSVDKELARNPQAKAAYDRIASGAGTPSDYHQLSPSAIRDASTGLRSSAYGQSVTNTQGRWDQHVGFSAAPDTVAISAMGNDPSLNSKRADIIGAREMAKGAVQELATSYDQTSGKFLGIDRAKEAALASMLYTAARGLAATGANLTENEQPLVTALSAPQIDINGATDYVHRLLTGGGDPSAIARSIGSVLDQGFNARLKGTGRVFSEYAPKQDKNAKIADIDAKIAALEAQITAGS